MRSNPTADERQTRSSNHYRWLILCVLAGAISPALTGAQAPTEPITVLKSGLHTICEGHSFVVTVTETGSTASASEVTIEFRDAADQRRAFTSGVLLRSRPVRLRVASSAGACRDQLRAIVMITNLTFGEGSERVVGLEDVDVNAFRIETKPPCAPPSTGSGPEGDCGGWRLSHLAPGRSPD